MSNAFGPERYQVRHTDSQRVKDGRCWLVCDTEAKGKIVARASSRATADELAKQFNEFGRVKRV
jgi:hypothetical protein